MHHPKSIEALIDNQARLWANRERLARQGGDEARDALVHLKEGPWITVSRQLASGGEELADQLAGKLGWQVFDREIVSAIAAQAHASERILSELDEHAVGTFNGMIANLLLPGVPSQREFIASLMKIVWGLARKGKAIFLGRGVNWFLDPRYGLRVRIVAPFESRVRRLAEKTGVSQGEAAEQLRHTDKEKTVFMRQAFGRDIDDPLGYDLVINVGTVAMEVAAETVLATLYGKLQAQR